MFYDEIVFRSYNIYINSSEMSKPEVVKFHPENNPVKFGYLYINSGLKLFT